jgi:hypothetical protein
MDVGLNGISTVLPQGQKVVIEKMYHICKRAAIKKTLVGMLHRFQIKDEIKAARIEAKAYS